MRYLFADGERAGSLIVDDLGESGFGRVSDVAIGHGLVCAQVRAGRAASMHCGALQWLSTLPLWLSRV
jgi:hypothetical protein